MAAKVCTVSELVEALSQLDPGMPVSVSGHYDNDQHQFYDSQMAVTDVVFDPDGTPTEEHQGDPLHPGQKVAPLLSISADCYTVPPPVIG